MEDVLGGRTDPARFQAFLADWEVILARRVEEAVATFRTVEGLHGLVLAGGVGRGEPWPLWDLDLLPIHADDRVASAAAEIERRRLVLLQRWIAEGWWTGLDIGRLCFTRSEVERGLSADDATVFELLHDDRWYYSLDKGFGGRSLLDPDGVTANFVQWLTARRFAPAVVQFRLDRDRREIRAAQSDFEEAVRDSNWLAATVHLRTAVKWVQTWHLEEWGHRDNSLGRLGTRFDALASAYGATDLVARLEALSDLDAASVSRRLETAPDWVWERHDRSWRARLHVGEPVSWLQDARDTLRVCALYGMGGVTEPAYPRWLAILDEESIATKVAGLRRIILD
jgi:hypothetical protein